LLPQKKPWENAKGKPFFLLGKKPWEKKFSFFRQPLLKGCFNAVKAPKRNAFPFSRILTYAFGVLLLFLFCCCLGKKGKRQGKTGQEPKKACKIGTTGQYILYNKKKKGLKH